MRPPELPNLAWLRAFVVFAEEMSFTRAAAILHVSQPALHVQVRKLSEQLGAELYRRRGRELELTAAGRRALAFGRELIARTERFVDELHGRERSSRTVICAGEGTFLYLLGPVIERARVEGLALEVLVRDAAGTLDAVREGAAHIGVLPIAEPPRGLEHRRLAEVGSLLVVPVGHRYADRRRLRLSDLAGERLIVPPDGRPLRTALELALAAAEVEWERAVEARGWPLTLQLTKLGLGAAVVNDFCVLPEGVRGVPLRGLPRQRYQAIRRGEPSRAPEHERLWRWLSELGRGPG